MPPAVPHPPEHPPRRARYLVPLGTPRRSEILAALATAAVLASALFAPLALLLTVTFHVVSKLSRWRAVWLAVPAVCGGVWLLAIGPGNAIAALAAAMRGVAALLSRLVLKPAALGRLPAAEADKLASQFPVAIILAAGAAAVAWWGRWLHTDEWDLPPVRPGLASFCRGQWTAASVRSGGVVTRDGACLGVDRVTGRRVALSWRDAGAGVLVTGAARAPVLASGWQLTHAAVRRRKPVFVVDLAGNGQLPGMLAAVCAATAAPLQVFGEDATARYEPGQSPTAEELAVLRASPLGRWLGPDPGATDRIRLAEVVRHRAVVLFSLEQARYGRAAEVIANLVAADIAAVYSALSRNGVPAEGLSWFTESAGVAPEALVRLTAPRSQAWLGSVLTTIVSATAATLAEQAGAWVIHRLADRDLAAELAARTRTRLMPAPHVLAQRGVPGIEGAALGSGTGAGGSLSTVPVPAVPADTLCGLSDDEFVLVTGLAAAQSGARSPATVLTRCQAIAGRIPAQARAAPGPQAGGSCAPGRPA
jgi:hypothetical protein